MTTHLRLSKFSRCEKLETGSRISESNPAGPAPSPQTTDGVEKLHFGSERRV